MRLRGHQTPLSYDNHELEKLKQERSIIKDEIKRLESQALIIDPAAPPTPRRTYLEFVTLPVHDEWNFNRFLDRQFERIKASGASDWLIDSLMMGTIFRMGRVRGSRKFKAMLEVVA